ncbi:DUF4097 domain-containing protein [Paenibacillus sp. SI8]|uniref:DUF4097 family beta strand repeat-containing protein n=1 Tax=unclassified Paenibacillus TaxID=185978 RepID=UPI00346555B4
MKRGAKFFLMIGFACLAIGIIGAAISFNDTDLTQSSTTIDIEKKIAATNIDTITIRTDNTGVTFIPSDTDEIKVHLVGAVTKNRAQDCTIDAVTKGTNAWEVNICQYKRPHISFNFDELKNLIANHNNQLRTEVTLPNKLYKAITVSSDTGSLNLEEVKADSLTATVDTGIIKIDRFEGKQLNLHSDTGSINVGDGQGTVKISTDTGSINAKLHDIGESVNLETDTGSIKLLLSPPPTSASFELQTDTGDTKLDVSGVSVKESSRHYVTGTIGDGSKKINVKTDTGSVTVTDK